MFQNGLKLSLKCPKITRLFLKIVKKACEVYKNGSNWYKTAKVRDTIK